MMSSWRVIKSRLPLKTRIPRFCGIVLSLAGVLAGVLFDAPVPMLPGVSPDTVLAAAAAPKVISVSPADGALDCPITQTFTVTFDQEMQATSINAGTLYIHATGGFALPAVVAYDAATRTATLVPSSPLVARTTYYVHLTTSVKSAEGLSVQGARLVWHFRTLNNTPPRVVATSPVDGSVNCPLNQVMSITFDSPMDPDKLTGTSFYFAKRGGPVLPATITYDPATKTATLTPKAELEEAATYEVSLIGTATGINGMFVYGAPIVWRFTTILVQPPAVQTRMPAPGAADQPLDVTVTVTFDRPMDRATITGDTFYIEEVGGDRVDAVLTANEAAATLAPKFKLRPETTYLVTLSPDIKSVKGAGLVDAPITWTFTTEELRSPFSDVPADHRYFTAIYELSERGVVGGFTNGTFRPAGSVTRQQFAKMIVKTLGIAPSSAADCPFGDVADQEGSDPAYPAGYVAACAARDIIRGVTAKTFAPYNNVTRYQAITMVVRAVDSVDRGLLKTPDPSYSSTWDPKLSPTHGQNARLAEANGLLGGLPLSQLDPGGPMTRGEIAQLLWNLVKLLEE